ncbi:MAG: ABC transporter ATP-binding protein [Candidatus Bathyarchaeia archaeon]
MEDLPYFIEMRSITKSFPGVLALDNVNFKVRKGEIHALLGENGAGKTTLMNILYGLYKPDKGEIIIEGKKVDIKSPREAINLGIGMVHQHFTLVPPFTVTENVILGLKSEKDPILDLKNAEKKVLEISKKYDLEIDPKAKVRELPVGVQQRVEIIKALYRNVKLLILDEPTTVLTPQEVQSLFKNLKLMVEKGLTIIFITHKLNEALTVSDRITVLRRGKLINTVNSKDVNESELIRMMIGRETLPSLPKVVTKMGNAILEVEDLHVLDDRGLPAVNGCTFKIHEGEILGIAGVAGNGQKELAEALMGLRKAIKGKIIINGKDLTNRSTREIMKAGAIYIPEDRLDNSLLSMSVAENLIVYNYGSFVNNYKFMDYNRIYEYSKRLIEEFNIVTPSEKTPTRALSGGNLQRILIARSFPLDFRLLIACQPTRGLDIASTSFVHRKLLECKERGSAVLLISENLDEVMEISDRIAVMFKGKIVGIVPKEEANEYEIGLMMTGAKYA